MEPAGKIKKVIVSVLDAQKSTHTPYIIEKRNRIFMIYLEKLPNYTMIIDPHVLYASYICHQTLPQNTERDNIMYIDQICKNIEDGLIELLITRKSIPYNLEWVKYLLKIIYKRVDTRVNYTHFSIDRRERLIYQASPRLPIHITRDNKSKIATMIYSTENVDTTEKMNISRLTHACFHYNQENTK